MDSDDEYNSAASVNSDDVDFDMDDESSSVADFGAGTCLA